MSVHNTNIIPQWKSSKNHFSILRSIKWLCVSRAITRYFQKTSKDICEHYTKIFQSQHGSVLLMSSMGLKMSPIV